MQCGHPLFLNQSSAPLPCGRCTACRVNVMRMWLGRLLLERQFNESVFVSFTYDEKYVPRLSDGRTTLEPADFTNLLKRIRKRSGPGFRYFGVGEYGSTTERAHFHLLAFAPLGSYWPYYDGFWQDVWTVDGESRGFTALSPADVPRLRYCLGYTIKKLTNRKDARLEGRHPEFSRQSRRPPLGAKGIQGILDTMYSRAGSVQIATERDVPTMYRLDGKIYPIGRYWRNWLRKQYGIEKPPQEDWTKPDDWNIVLKSARNKAHAAARRLAAKAQKRYAL